MTACRRIAAVAGASAASVAGTSAALAAPSAEPLGGHVSECARIALDKRPDPPQVTCVHDDHVHTFATFGELVAHVREHDLR